MQENEFEKQLRQKMEELRLNPSNAIWQNIEANIPKKKRRRLVWLLIPLLLVLLCGGYWFLNSINESKPLNKQLSQTVIKSDTTNREDNVQKSVDTKHQSSPNLISPKAEKNIATQDLIQRIASQTKTAKKQTRQPSKLNVFTNTSNKPELKDKIESSTTTISHDDNSVASPTEYENKSTQNDVDLKQKIAESDPTNTTREVTNVVDSTSKKITANTENEKNKQVGGLNKENYNRIKTKSSWQFGVTFSPGVSGVPNKLLSSLDKSFAYADMLYLTAPAANYSAPLPSKIKSSGALIAGIFLEKNISKKNSITVGLNYKTFSTTTKVGVKNDTSRAYSLYDPVNSYHNYYHFLELPVSYKMQISSNKFPIFWDLGISLSQLIGSNALQLDNVSVLYYRNNSLFNKSQIGFNTRLYADVMSKKKTSLLIGPALYYGATKVAAEGLYKNQHFTFIGLRTQLLFKK
jgi:hypothetical protein